jgi:LmbE family N-acetylglucosaminyl deacetylase
MARAPKRANPGIGKPVASRAKRGKRGPKLQPYRIYETDPERRLSPLPDFMVIDENKLHQSPIFKGKKVVVYSPHASDFVVRSGTTIHLLNRPGEGGKPLNDVHVVVTGTGHRGVLDNITADRIKKIDIRAEEGRLSAEALGLRAPKDAMVRDGYGARNWGQYSTFNAFKTYDNHEIDASEQRRMDYDIECKMPDVVMVPSKFDRVQSMNRNTREMVIKSIRKHLAEQHRKGVSREVLIMEYPTAQMASIPDKNLWINFKNPKLADETKKRAIKHQKSQKFTQAEMDQMIEEAHEAFEAAEEFRMVQNDHSKIRVSRALDYGHALPVIGGSTARGEHFKLLRARVASRRGVPVVKIEPVRSPGEHLAKMAGLMPKDRSKDEGKYYREEKKAHQRERRRAKSRQHLKNWKEDRKQRAAWKKLGVRE